MLGLVGTVGGAVALEVRRWRKKGTVEELNEYKKKERELKSLLETTTAELERAKQSSTVAKEKAHAFEAKVQTLQSTLDEARATADRKIADISKQKEQLQQNNSKLVLSNLMLMTKAKHLEDHSRALVERQEDLKHQLEQLQRDRAAAEASFEASLATLKSQVTAVLNRYFDKSIDLAAALGEMQAMGIEVVQLPAAGARGSLEFETKLVLDSPHRMQRLMGSRNQQLTAQELPQLSFPMGISKDPATGTPRITLAWRADPQIGAGSAGNGDTQQTHQDQQQQSGSKPGTLAALQDAGSGAGSNSSKASSSSSSPAKIPQLQDEVSSQKQKAKSQTSIMPNLSWGKLSIKSATSPASKRANGPVATPQFISAMAADDAFDSSSSSSSRALTKV